LLKEKVSFASELLAAGDFFFNNPVAYDEKVKTKKWNADVASSLTLFIKELVANEISKATDIEAHLNAFAETKGLNKGQLMQPLRWVATGQAGGPPIFDLIELLGVSEVADRLKIAQEKFPV
jgi:glutamyl-tRNA synthetase